MMIRSSMSSPRRALLMFHFSRSEASVHYSRPHLTQPQHHSEPHRCRLPLRGSSSVRPTSCLSQEHLLSSTFGRILRPPHCKFPPQCLPISTQSVQVLDVPTARK